MAIMINDTPRFTMALVQANCFRQEPMTVVDVGASGGYSPYWNHFGDQLRVIGFEPNPDEFLKCRPTPVSQVYPFALGRRKETKTLTVTRWPYSSSTVPFNMNFWRRFPNASMFDPVRTEQFETIDLDSFCRENQITGVDFIKIDTEGSELEILEGGEGVLSSGTLALMVEVAFYPYQVERPLFADIDVFLRKNEFYLYDLETVRLARSSLPPLDSYIAEPSRYGQVIAGDALYLRDLAVSHESVSSLSPIKLLKAICLFELFSQHDSAIELLECALINRLLPQELSGLIDLLVPKVFDRYISLADYRAIYDKLPQLT